MNISGLGLGPEAGACFNAGDSHPWYIPNFWNTPEECQCLIDSGAPIGEQCWSVAGVATTMAGTTGSAIGAGASAIGEGIGTGVGTGLSNFASSVDLSGLLLLGIVGMAIYLVKR